LGPLSPISKEWREIFSRGKIGRCVKLTMHFELVLKQKDMDL
jgi:hypothetical protein